MRYENAEIDKLPVDSLCEIPGDDAIKLNSNENPFPPAPEVLNCLKNVGKDANLFRLYPDVTYLSLKEEIANYVGSRVKFDHFKLSDKNIFLANGSDQVLAMIFETFFENSTRPVLMPEVSYCYDIWAQVSKSKFKVIANDDDFGIDLEKFKQKDAKGVIFANPNTTGLTIPLEKIRDLAKFYSGKGLVIVDEAYIEFSSADSAVKLVEEFDNVIVVSTFSKAFSLAGARVGFAISSENNIEALIKLKSAYSLVLISGATVKMAEKTIENIDYYHEKIRKIKENRQKFTEFLSKLQNFTFIPSDASFMFVKHSKLSSEEIYEILKKNNIYVRVYSSGRLKGFVRITIGREDQMDAVMKILKKLN